MKVLLSIKPEFVEKIIKGEKKFEFRRRIFSRKVESVVIYATSPWKVVIGEFSVEEIIESDLVTLWIKTKDYSGIDEKFFWEYFKGLEKGFAIKIGDIKLYQHYLDIEKNFGVKPPQSYIYIYEQ